MSSFAAKLFDKTHLSFVAYQEEHSVYIFLLSIFIANFTLKVETIFYFKFLFLLSDTTEKK